MGISVVSPGECESYIAGDSKPEKEKTKEIFSIITMCLFWYSIYLQGHEDTNVLIANFNALQFKLLR